MYMYSLISQHYIIEGVTLSLMHMCPSTCMSPSYPAIPANITVRPVPASSLVFVGSNITYTCSARGAPPPTIIWLHNGLPIRVTATNLESRETTSSLVLSDMVKSNSGVYTCRAANEVEGTAVGSQEVEANVAVIGELAEHTV